MNSRTSWQATSGLTPAGAQHGRGRFIRPKRASSANMMRNRRPRLVAVRRAFLTASGNPFFKGVLRCAVALGMKRTRHQLAPAMPIQQIVDRAVAGCVANGLFVGRLEILDIQQFASASSLGKIRQQCFFPLMGHVLTLASADWFWLERFNPAFVIEACAHGSPCSVTRPSLPQSLAASSQFRAAAPSGCARDVWVKFFSTEEALFSAAGLQICCI